MRVILHYTGKLKDGSKCNGHVFAEISRFSEKELRRLLDKVKNYVLEARPDSRGVDGELTITFVTPLQDDDSSGTDNAGDDGPDLATRIVANICEDL